MKRLIGLWGLWLVCGWGIVAGQGRPPERDTVRLPVWPVERHALSVWAGNISVKEGFNYGLVFNGPQLNLRYALHWTAGRFDFSYNPELAVGVPLSRGMAAVNLQITPVELAFQAAVFQTDRHRLQVGGDVAARYRYQAYPDLQNAHLFWFGEIGLSLRLRYTYRWHGGSLCLRWSNSLLGFVSHTSVNPPYFYSLKLADFVVQPHRHLQFGSFNRYDRTAVQIEYAPAALARHSFGIGLAYTGYCGEVRYQTLNTYLSWRKTF